MIFATRPDGTETALSSLTASHRIVVWDSSGNMLTIAGNLLATAAMIADLQAQIDALSSFAGTLVDDAGGQILDDAGNPISDDTT